MLQVGDMVPGEGTIGPRTADHTRGAAIQRAVRRPPRVNNARGCRGWACVAKSGGNSIFFLFARDRYASRNANAEHCLRDSQCPECFNEHADRDEQT